MGKERTLFRVLMGQPPGRRLLGGLHVGVWSIQAMVFGVGDSREDGTMRVQIRL